jgi:hypothetical protein
MVTLTFGSVFAFVAIAVIGVLALYIQFLQAEVNRGRQVTIVMAATPAESGLGCLGAFFMLCVAVVVFVLLVLAT